jgi:anti-sigma regulatory factor (Ser/Thr protein kinase)
MPGMDEIVLTIPRERPFYGVAHLVLGGLGSRLNLTLEHLEDLQLALDSLLAQHDGQGDVTLCIRIREGAIETEIGPFAPALSDELGAESGGVGLRRILETVSDGVELGERDGEAWVTLTKNVDGAGQ